MPPAAACAGRWRCCGTSRSRCRPGSTTTCRCDDHRGPELDGSTIRLVVVDTALEITMSSQAFLVVRSVLSQPSLRENSIMYASDHLPRAIVDLRAEKAWRLWSETDANV